jgi:two-component system response regulator AtoC
MKCSSSPSGKARILLVNHNAAITRLLDSARYQVETVSSEEVIRRAENGLKPDLVLLHLNEDNVCDLEMIEAWRRVSPNLKIVVISQVSDVSIAVRAMRLGAIDYIIGPRDGQDFFAEVERLLSDSTQELDSEAGSEARGHFEQVENHISFLAVSPVMRKIRAQVAQVAKVDIPVLLLGESGVGKEVLARLIHKLSRRSGKTMVKVNCAALPADLLESELFGYEPGAFTGANRSKPGTLELCDKGTVFLDEIGEMSPTVQAKLLHVLQDGKFSRLGGRTTLTSDFRVLAATNINVKEAISTRAFREDLYYRLNAFTINVPPLRERSEEIPILIKHFMQQFSEKYDCSPAECSPNLIRACLRYRWPGNLRELGNFIKRYMVLQDEAAAIAELEEQQNSSGIDVEFSDEDCLISAGGLKSMVQDLKERAEPKIIERVLIATKWNCKLAAKQLKISYKALLYKMKQYHVLPPGVTGPGLRNAQG